MKIPEHLAFSYLVAQLGVQQQFGAAGTALVVAAGFLPDLDGLTLLGGWRVYRTFHRVLGHGLPMTLFGPAVLALLGRFALGLAPGGTLWIWLQLACMAHLVTDVLFYRWPVQLLWPVSARGWGFGWVGWNDLVPTFLLYSAVAVAVAWPALAPTAAVIGLGGLAAYLVVRSSRRPRSAWAMWLAGGWTLDTPRFWRWLTGDFVT